MDRYAVVGNPVGHSLSPRIHAAFAAATGQALRYDALPAPLDGFVATVEDFFRAGGAGLNVTVPFKEQAAAWVDSCTPAAAAAGAVNTIERRADGFRGHNTDGAGLVRDLLDNCQEALAGARVLLIGAGGAARGVLRPVLAEGPERLVVANRSRARAEDMVRDLPVGHVAAVAGLDEALPPFDIVINATAAGLHGDGVAPVSPAAVRGAFCYDLMYAPPGSEGTAFCRWTLDHGARRAVDGLGMLVEQAALAFALWRGVAPETGPVLNALRRGEV
ncbi:MAG: shikimate dehydrogenase [Pseudomonadales bacterium]